MHRYYKDIISRLGEPRWWDEFAVPRYDPFTPQDLADIYANECVFMLIECQACGHEFEVAMSFSVFDAVANPNTKTLAERVKSGYIHYGDPPNNECCAAGASMNCEDRAILQFWRRVNHTWERVPELEIILPD